MAAQNRNCTKAEGEGVGEEEDTSLSSPPPPPLYTPATQASERPQSSTSFFFHKEMKECGMFMEVILFTNVTL